MVRYVLAEHELLVGAVVLEELRRVLRIKIRLPREVVAGIDSLLQDQEMVPKPKKPSPLPIADKSDRWVLASAVSGNADVLVTGDSDPLDLGENAPLPILDPRGFWNLARE